MSAREVLIEKVLPALRRRGLIARANFACCGGCGHYELTEMAAGKKEKVGYVFWHAQDEAGLKRPRSAGTYLRFAATRSVLDVEVGEAISEEARMAGLLVEWDGSPGQAVWVQAAG